MWDAFRRRITGDHNARVGTARDHRTQPRRLTSIEMTAALMEDESDD
jgi:hypothetical protein